MKTREWIQGAGLAALTMAIAAGTASAQAPETQSQANPAPADAAVNQQAGQNNSPGAASQGAAATPEAAPTDNGSGTGEIVVTAQFRSQNLQRTPLAITAVSGAMLEARSQTNLSQVANDAPSVTLKPQGAAFGPSLAASIRGVGQFDFNPGFEPGVGVYVDDVYFATLTGSILDLLDLDRVEVLRGPQGTLSGKNSIGGSIKLYSKKPTGDTGGYISGTYGERNRIDLRGSADLKLGDTLFMRVSGVAKKQDGYVKRLDYGCLNPGSGITPIKAQGEGCLLAKDGDVDYQAGRVQLRWVPDTKLEVNLAADYTHDERRTAGSVLTYANYNGTGNIDPYTGGSIRYDSRFLCGKYCNFATFNSPADPAHGYVNDQSDDRSRFVGYGFSGTIDYKLTDTLSLKSITSYRHYNTFFGNDDDFSPLAHSLGRSYVRFHSWSEELRLNGSIGAENFLEYTIGGFYQKQRSVYTTFQDLRYAAAGFPPFIGIDQVPTKSRAVFGQASAHLTDQLTVIGGIRYTKESKAEGYTRNSPDGTPHPLLGSLNGVVGHYSGDNVDYRGVVQYQLTPKVMVYGQYSTGFKGGGVSPRPFYFKQVITFGPERLNSWEAGAKTQLFDNRARINVAGFYSHYNDIQLTVLACPDISPEFPAPCPITRNVGNAIIKGLEGEVTLEPTDGLLIDGSASYVDFGYRKNARNLAQLTAIGVPGSGTTPYNPKWKYSAGIQYAVPIGEIGSVTPRVDVAYQSHIFTEASDGPLSRIPGYTIANARITYRNPAGDLEISGELLNLFNKYYFLTSFDLTGAGAGLASAQPGRPREWALTVKKKF